MTTKARLLDFRLEEYFDRDKNSIGLELRVDWSNDRHQAVRLKGSDSESLSDSLNYLLAILATERNNGKI